jgi:hypothetical protein
VKLAIVTVVVLKRPLLYFAELEPTHRFLVEQIVDYGQAIAEVDYFLRA